MSGLHRMVACATNRGLTKNYFKYFSFYEMTQADISATPKTLRKWRKFAPDHARFVVRVDSQIATKYQFKGEQAEQIWQKAMEHRDLLKSELILIHTPSSFRPSTENISALRDFIKSHQSENFNIAFRADGLWEDTDTYFDLCQELQIVPVIDPINWPDDQDMPFGNIIYWRILGRKGLGVRLSEFDLENIDEWSADAEGEVYIALTSPHMSFQGKYWASRLNQQTLAMAFNQEDDQEDEDAWDEDLGDELDDDDVDG